MNNDRVDEPVAAPARDILGGEAATLHGAGVVDHAQVGVKEPSRYAPSSIGVGVEDDCLLGSDECTEAEGGPLVTGLRGNGQVRMRAGTALGCHRKHARAECGQDPGLDRYPALVQNVEIFGHGVDGAHPLWGGLTVTRSDTEQEPARVL